ncbi:MULTISPECIES: GOLPH3/VPS74 family protein [unclassified Pseudonocardia]|uniref:GOLPH3/VPS74 family protein n=1 Tax=unclassified Pseudonocardia TaxID=2619320 RepID=UPI0007062B93|nr:MULTISPECIES: GPP34 family phosphoprotein [unclassified Pseudonocardia]ALL85819.1 hypothetical protein AD017_32170 [Pseudonocardia sp. EC080619-01]
MEHGALATGLYLIAFDEPSGRSGLALDLLACGLVGAQLADLVIAGSLTVDPQQRVVATGTGPAERASGEAANLVMDSVAQEPRCHPVRAWVDVLGDPLLEAVENDVLRRGVLARTEDRGLFGRRKVRLTVSVGSAAHGPALALRGMLANPGLFTLSGAVTLVLISALGVERVLEPHVDRAVARDLAQGAAGHLPEPISRLRAGLAEAAAAVSTVVRR